MVAAAEKVFAVRAKNIVLIPIQYFVAAPFTVPYLSITDSICTAFECLYFHKNASDICGYTKYE